MGKVAGNIVDGIPLAAQIIVTEFAMETNQGYIDQTNFDGTIAIRNGPTIRINDPNAVFSAGFSLPFMVADDKSPSISSFSGFPMCVPRSANDTLCPSSNRPLVPGSNAPRRIFQAPDALIMAPFLPGDFIVYRGFRQGNQLICFEIVAWNVQITTQGAPTYVRVEETLVGIYTPNTLGEVAETRFIGYVSDPSVTVSIVAIDIDPCTGHETFRPISVAQNRPEGGGRNKWVSRIDGTQPSVYTREYRAVTSTGTVTTRNGIVAGQYVSPILEWIQPELLAPGNEPLVHEFSGLSHLTKGIGLVGESRNLFGPLSPFPQSGVTVFDVTTCTTTPPDEGEGPTPAARITGSIGSVTGPSPLFVRSDDTFILRGFQDNTSPVFSNTDLTWTWSIVANQSAGSQSNFVTFTPATDGRSISLKLADTAPTGEYVFQLAIASASQNRTGAATFTANFFTGADTVSIEAVTWTSSQSGTIGVTCKSNYLVDNKVGMSVTYPGDNGITTSVMAATPPGTGLWSFSTRRVARPGTVTCRSLLNGQASRAGTTA
ncbi:hypothetical protein B0T18DRAFT_470350 [Schizothecium vesticola]|uniref:Uncharacterized protein n=1 Tax=Schizothecium vesticola TaxID=314040 RepID=A0AA40K374_9PEZI|nr:hypothetical protein B0T18DRAFT_470350 [Schizothecium vesticola]